MAVERFIAFASDKCVATTISKYLSVIGQKHLQLLGYNPLARYPQAKLLLKGVARADALAGYAPRQKEAFTVELFAASLPHLNTASADGLMWASLISVGIHFLLRASELVPCPTSHHFLRVRDVQLERTPSGIPALVLTVRSSKTNLHPVQRRIAANGAPTCPVGLVQRYMVLRGAASPDDPFFAPPAGCAPPTRARLSALLCTLASKALGRAFHGGSQSLRRGGCTTLASRPDVSPLLIKLVGRWTSDCWEHIYVHLDSYTAVHLAAAFHPRPPP